jgi:CspA family cold shock protein
MAKDIARIVSVLLIIWRYVKRFCITFKYTAVFLVSIEESEMVTGTVKFFNRTKSFGFITGDDGKDYFVHATGLKPGVSIAEGDKVSFEVVAGDKGPKADKVDKAA